MRVHRPAVRNFRAHPVLLSRGSLPTRRCQGSGPRAEGDVTIRLSSYSICYESLRIYRRTVVEIAARPPATSLPSRLVRTRQETVPEDLG